MSCARSHVAYPSSDGSAAVSLAVMILPGMTPMTGKQRDARIDAYRHAFDRAVLGVDESLRPRVAGEWPAAVQRAVAAGVADYDERGRLRLVSR